MNVLNLQSAALRDRYLLNIRNLKSGPAIDSALSRIYGDLGDAKLSEPDCLVLVDCLAKHRERISGRYTAAKRVPQLAAVWREDGMSRFKERVRPTMPVHKKPEYMARRRTLASSGMVPKALAASFTTGQLAVLTVVGQEVAKFGHCALPQQKLAALAGVCWMTVLRAVRLAEELKLLDRQTRERRGQNNLPNIVRIRSKEWRDWIAKRFQKRFNMREFIGKLKSQLPGAVFPASYQHNCYPTPSKKILEGNRLDADYSVSLFFDGKSVSASPG
ncbi:MAG: hypothetical protein WCC66_02735 [Rhizobiaceae bacterium]